MTKQVHEAAPVQEQENAPEAHVAQEAQPSGIAGVVAMFGLTPQLFLGQLINFLIVLLVLSKFVYKPLLRALDERESRIAKSIEDADAIARRLKEAEEEKVDLLRAAREEADAYVAKSMMDTEERKREMLSGAKAEVERLIAQGKVQLQEEHDAMLLSLRKEVVDIALAAATKVLGETITEKKSQSLAEEVVRKLT